MAPRIGVLALQGDVREHLAAFGDAGACAVAVRTAEELAGVDGLAIPGGESTTMSRLLRAFHLEDPLREAVAAGLPCFATCAGMILLSRAILDGRPDQIALGTLDITVRRNGYGRQVDSFEAEVPIPAAGSAPVPAVFIRAPLVEEVGPMAEVAGELEGRAVAVAQGPHLAFAFHPEMTGDRRLQRLFLDRLGGDGRRR